MSSRVLLLVGVLTLLGTGCRNTEGAVKLTVSYEGFKPGCIRVAVKDANGEGEARTTEVPGKGEFTGGAVTVAVFREASWSNSLLLTAEAFEKECTGTKVVSASETMTVNKGDVSKLELKLAATDADQDGYVSEATGGSDCNDKSTAAYPGAKEICNNQDDNCDDVQDEGFNVGLVCDKSDGCQGAWTCNAEGTATTCEAKEGQWHPDADKDGKGSNKVPGITACKQPDGYVANDLDCDDNNVQRYTGAPELCNAVDDNCDGEEDDGLRVGQDCTGQSGCGGKRACATDGGVVCDSPELTILYADKDQDTHGALDAGKPHCGSTLPGYVASSDDCDDTRANVYTGAPEICDDLDNNCNGPKDEGFGVGEDCGQELGCTGKKACDNSDGGVLCAYVTPPSTYYTDEDRDSYGNPDAGVMICAPDAGYSLNADDCNDGNPFTNPDAGELCDGEDNNCNGTTEDEGTVCPTPDGGSWVEQSSGSGDNWKSVAVWGDGGVWVTGGSNLLQVRRPGEMSFDNLSGQCTGAWNAVWVDPRDGKAILGGENATVGSHLPGATNCENNGTYATDTDVRGIIGVPTDSGFDIHLIGKDRLHPYEGRVLRYTGLTAPLVGNPVGGQLWDVHGISQEILFAVGGHERPGEDARIYSFKPDQNLWVDENVQSISGIGDKILRGVWVVNPRLAYAVGMGGTVLMWNGASWNLHSKPSTENLLSVLAFGKNAVYVSTDNGKVYRYNGSSWSTVLNSSSPTGALNDLAGTSPADIWVVGDKGKRFHWPQ
ncbi:hypothetical protein F0U60_47665 [Archangium minus]|uniref:Lipoprotein n=1 Tax=Archangium minus TaxID=83450 RepID=A0ABY9X6C9_9BACT|nr:hypothetical protein F0U60_47665 [Archangium minus]